VAQVKFRQNDYARRLSSFFAKSMRHVRAETVPREYLDCSDSIQRARAWVVRDLLQH
jgi:hypothetical protein